MLLAGVAVFLDAYLVRYDGLDGGFGFELRFVSVWSWSGVCGGPVV